LQGALAHKGFLNVMERWTIAQAFEGGYVTTRDANREQKARTDRPTVEQDRAGSTRSDTAALPHTPEFESVPQDFEQCVGILDGNRLFSPIDS
jgi:hypothetical protein